MYCLLQLLLMYFLKKEAEQYKNKIYFTDFSDICTKIGLQYFHCSLVFSSFSLYHLLCWNDNGYYSLELESLIRTTL